MTKRTKWIEISPRRVNGKTPALNFYEMISDLHAHKMRFNTHERVNLVNPKIYVMLPTGRSIEDFDRFLSGRGWQRRSRRS